MWQEDSMFTQDSQNEYFIVINISLFKSNKFFHFIFPNSINLNKCFKE